MDLKRYLEIKRERSELTPKRRVLCYNCLQPDFSCYCKHVTAFDPQINFVILMHPIESRRRIATGRMAHLCLKQSHLLVGQTFGKNARVQKLIDEPEYHCMALYPGPTALNLSGLSLDQRANIIPKDKKLRIFVIDGTWNTARTTMNQSENLKSLPRICFTPERASNFRVRKQPNSLCYSTIEAIHHTIELLNHCLDGANEPSSHHGLIKVFDKMVETQLDFVEHAHKTKGKFESRRIRKKFAKV